MFLANKTNGLKSPYTQTIVWISCFPFTIELQASVRPAVDSFMSIARKFLEVPRLSRVDLQNNTPQVDKMAEIEGWNILLAKKKFIHIREDLNASRLK